MDCKKAGILMMKYMDSVLTQDERLELYAHTDGCQPCKEDFIAYEHITKKFETRSACLFDVPHGFEERVMKEVRRISSKSPGDTVPVLILGIISILMGFGALIGAYQTEIAALILGLPYVSGVMAGMMTALGAFMNSFRETAAGMNQYLGGIYSIVDSYRYAMMFTVLALTFTQYLLCLKNRAKA